MPINIPDTLPARGVLESENIFVMTLQRALHQDIRPVRIAILNLMPTKITTETQLLRLIGNTPLQIDIDLVRTDTYKARNVSEEHMLAFYKSFDEVKDNKYDGLIITGAPVELIPFEDVVYWGELCKIMEWSKHNVTSTFHICWGAQAALYYHYGINKHLLPKKLFGVYEHYNVERNHPLLRGFNDVYNAPHSRHTTVYENEITAIPSLKVLSRSNDAGVYIAASNDGKQIFVTGHSEYDATTLNDEYVRDVDKGLDIAVPEHYFPGDDPTKAPHVTWRSHANLLYTNWLNYYVYQTTPYDLNEIQ